MEGQSPGFNRATAPRRRCGVFDGGSGDPDGTARGVARTGGRGQIDETGLAPNQAITSTRQEGAGQWSSLVEPVFDVVESLRDVFLDDVPDEFGIHCRVVVDELVSHPRNFSPVDLTVSGAKSLG